MDYKFMNHGGQERDTRQYALNKEEFKDRLFTPKQLADYLCSSVQALSQYRALGIGPTYFKIGKMVRYPLSEVNKWLEQIRVLKYALAYAPSGNILFEYTLPRVGGFLYPYNPF